MKRIRSACVKTSSSKTCFVSLSGDLAEAIGLRVQGQPFALQLQWESGSAFTSWSGEVIHNNKHDVLTGSPSIVLLGKKFADSLGLNEDQQVLVEPVLSIPSCNRISVDPLSANDWEILELHAGYIESHLLNQVRVVFPQQKLPIWIQNNTCVVVQIVDLEPCTNCVRLDEFTEVVVSPKTRDTKSVKQGSVTSSQFTSQTISQTSGIPDSAQQLVEASGLSDGNRRPSTTARSVVDTEEQSRVIDTGLLSRFSSYFHTLFYAHGNKSVTNENQTLEPLQSSEPQLASTSNDSNAIRTFASTSQLDENVLGETDFDMWLRVQPELSMARNISKSKYAFQPSAVFVDFASLPPKVLKSWTCNLDFFPPADGTIVKTVQITKLLSPKERTTASSNAATVNRVPNSQENTDSITQETRVTDEAESLSRASQDTQPSHWIVNMVMTSSSSSTLNDITKRGSHKLGVASHVLPHHIVMSNELRHLLDTKDLSLVKVQSVSYGPSVIKGIILHPFGDNTQEDIPSSSVLLDAFHKWICSVCSRDTPLLLCSGMLLTCDIPQAGHSVQFVVTVLSHDELTSNSADRLSYYQLTPETLNSVTVVIGTPSNSLNNPSPVISPLESRAQNLKHSIADLGGVTECFHKCLDHALVALKQRPVANHLGGNIITGLHCGALLICGSGAGAGVGCGKTALAHAVCHQLRQWPVCAHITVVDCIPFRGKRVESIQKQWQQVFVEAAWYQPSVILFDDLDQLVSAPSALQEMGGEALYKRRLAQVFKDLVNAEIDHNSRVVVIATSKSRDSLHPSLLTSRGCYIFQCCVELHPPDANQRQEILHTMINKRFPQEDSQELELSSLVKKTEGFSPKDLGSLLDRAFHKAAIRKLKNSKEGGFGPAITTQDLKEAVEGFTPAALRGVKLHTAGELGWCDVGGLSAVKGTLMETLLWPTKYSWLFSKCPLRMRSGLLLYGPPGTGKTMLAGVVAKECGLNFISIKGPELLSKYIGASEQAVRDMFTRAQSAKPCILFFDEFDSLAPRRGHDSTGVTDRVVNQLLTQLDGVEGLDGVYILAATSRPDLIDPALLRPGRLDKCLYCGIPEKSERLEILRALSRSLLLAKDTKLADISDMCENFTGADLKALLYNAQLAAIHRNTSNSQLYKGLFNKDSERGGDENDSLQIKDIKEKVVYIPNLVKGPVHVSSDELTKLHSEVMVIEEHLRQRNRSDKKMSATEVSKQQPAGGIEISQSDLLQAASSMGPSVSDSERRKYQAIYDTFIKSRGGDFGQNSTGQGKATLA